MVELLAAKTQEGESIAQRLTTAQTLHAPYILQRTLLNPRNRMVSRLFQPAAAREHVTQYDRHVTR